MSKDCDGNDIHPGARVEVVFGDTRLTGVQGIVRDTWNKMDGGPPVVEMLGTDYEGIVVALTQNVRVLENRT